MSDPISAAMVAMGMTQGAASVAAPIVSTIGTTALNTGMNALMGGGGGSAPPIMSASGGTGGGVTQGTRPTFGGPVGFGSDTDFGISGTTGFNPGQGVSVMNNTPPAAPAVNPYSTAAGGGLGSSLASAIPSLLTGLLGKAGGSTNSSLYAPLTDAFKSDAAKTMMGLVDMPSLGSAGDLTKAALNLGLESNPFDNGTNALAEALKGLGLGSNPFSF